MAGSYGHVDFVDGRFSSIENLRDAGECIHELLWLTGYLARRVLELKGLGISDPSWEDLDSAIKELLDAEYYPMLRGEKSDDAVMQRVHRIREGHLPYQEKTPRKL